MTPLDYDQTVTALGFADGRLVPVVRTRSTLADVVRVIVEEWDHQQVPHILIVSEAGPIEGLDAIMQVYERPDFPLPRRQAF